jgi:hypothetical protein
MMHSQKKTATTSTRSLSCKHCENLGLANANTHALYVKGVLVCPVMKNTECTYCHTKGHTVSHCTSAIMPPRNLTPAVVVKNKLEKQLKCGMADRIRNKYAALFDDDEEEEKEEAPAPAAPAPAAPAPRDEFPALVSVAPRKIFTEKTYSAALLTTVEDLEKIAREKKQSAILLNAIKKPAEKPDFSILKIKRNCCWADSDSDSDDE